jgi:hypothetical protein
MNDYNSQYRKELGEFDKSRNYREKY